MKKTYRIKTNNQEQLQRKQNESDATSKWIEFQKTRPRRRIQDNENVPVHILSGREVNSQEQREEMWRSLRTDTAGNTIQVLYVKE